MLATNQLYQIISQLMPQIEQKLRKKIEQQYELQLQKIRTQGQNKLHQMSLHYNSQIQNLKKSSHQNNVNTCQCKSTEMELRKQLSALQRQRSYYLKQQTQYRKVIFKLANGIYKTELSGQYIKDNLGSLNTDKLSQLNRIQLKQDYSQISQQFDKYCQIQTQLKGKPDQNLSLLQEQKRNNKLQEYFISQNDSSLPLKLYQKHNRSLSQKNQLKTTQPINIEKPNIISRINMKSNKQNHYTSILSPPKDDKDDSDKNQMESPAIYKKDITNKNQIGRQNIFWNNQMKTKILTLIKISK